MIAICSEGGLNFTWNKANRLVCLASRASVASLFHKGDGIRVEPTMKV
jgi:hypothetical protein